MELRELWSRESCGVERVVELRELWEEKLSIEINKANIMCGIIYIVL